ncbi:TIGR03086 family metal-binding protein [Actinomadura hibisca]|uniref:TIGR03086 family metal-binding protein n=1 Tax=Actinomadura hibisca TaxID=68565 RepID=UPI0008350100|nr:TIGR03086 family metal-binding protein [Actinomadura hibisca]
MNELHSCLAASAAEAARIARGVRAEQLDGPTPCAEFDVRTLVNHWVLYTSHGLECRALRRDIPGELMERDFAGEAGWAEAYAVQLDRAVVAWGEPSAWEGPVLLGDQEYPAEEVLPMIIKELTVHGWDVARATGQDIAVPPEVGELMLKVVTESAELYRQYGGFAEPVAVAPDASAFERALAESGRDPRWTP